MRKWEDVQGLEGFLGGFKAGRKRRFFILFSQLLPLPVSTLINYRVINIEEVRKIFLYKS